MPIEKGSSRSVISHNISEMEASGHPHNQAVAAALHEAKDSNIPDPETLERMAKSVTVPRIERNVIIARSGCYDYGMDELFKLNLPKSSIPDQHRNRTSVTVYTPSTTLIEAADLFVKLPLVKEHPMVDGMMVTPDNFQDLVIGWSGDTIEVVTIPNSQEIGIKSICQLLSRDALDYYNAGFRDVSPGYFGIYVWRDGVSPDGKEYQIVKEKIYASNHLAFTMSGRGGPEISLDSNYASLNYYATRMTTDSAIPSFRDVVSDIAQYASEYDSEEIKSGLESANRYISSLPNCQEKSILTRIMEDFKNVSSLTGDSAKLAANLLADKFEDLDKKIMEDSMGLFSKKPTTDAAPPVPDEKPAEDAAPAVDSPPVAEETPTPEVAAEPAPSAPGDPAPSAPVAVTAMEVSAMPDDVSAVSDDELRALLNGLIKFAKSIAPGEALEPQHQEPVTPDSDIMPPDSDKITGDATSELTPTTDSVFRMPMGSKSASTASLDDLVSKLSSKRSK